MEGWWITLLPFFVVPCFTYLVVVWVIRKKLVAHWGQPHFPDSSHNLRGKVALVTGAGSGVGFETSVALANRGATVIVTGRTLRAAKKLIIRLRHKTFVGKLTPFALDLSSFESIRNFCDNVKAEFDALDILVNNAGVLFPITKREVSHEGHEMHLAVNHLGHFLLTSLLWPLIKKGQKSRVVVVASLNHGVSGINFDDIMFKSTPLGSKSMSDNVLYMQSKMANILFAHELRRRLAKSGQKDVEVYACCPGIVNTNISRNLDIPRVLELLTPLFKVVMKTPSEGAQTVLHCALSDELKDQKCVLFRHCKPWNVGDHSSPDNYFAPSKPTVYPEEDAAKLWKISEELCQTLFNI